MMTLLTDFDLTPILLVGILTRDNHMVLGIMNHEIKMT